MKAVTASQMRDLDKKAIEDYRIPGLILMENAGHEMFETMFHVFEDELYESEVLICCGKGNNGGDGFVVARHLYNSGIDVEVMLTSPQEEFTGDALVNLKALEKISVPVNNADGLDKDDLIEYISNFDVVVDALLGTGVKGSPRGIYKEIIQVVNDLDCFVFSVDIPSGLDPDTGLLPGPAMIADVTVTMGLPKIGMVLYPGRDYVGELYIADISMPPELLFSQDLRTDIIDQTCLPVLYRYPDSHKGDYGKVLIIGTSPGLTGAGYMASTAALNAGSGLITLAVPRSLNSILETKLTEVMTLPVKDADSCFGPEALDTIIEFAEKTDAIALGPGLGKHPQTKKFVEVFLERCNKPLVIDADGLNLIADNPGLIKKYPAPLILTPHYGEFARLTGKSIEEIKSDKIKHAVEFAEQFGVTLVLKGAETIIVDETGEVFINVTGNPGMATGGMGDVLTGLIVSFLGQGLDKITAPVAASFVMGITGDDLILEHGLSGINPGLILNNLHFTITEYLEIQMYEDEYE